MTVRFANALSQLGRLLSRQRHHPHQQSLHRKRIARLLPQRENSSPQAHYHSREDKRGRHGVVPAREQGRKRVCDQLADGRLENEDRQPRHTEATYEGGCLRANGGLGGGCGVEEADERDGKQQEEPDLLFCSPHNTRAHNKKALAARRTASSTRAFQSNRDPLPRPRTPRVRAANRPSYGARYPVVASSSRSCGSLVYDWQ